jgi:hypothetical protein
MAALGHFIFELLKVAILSLLYTGIFLFGRLVLLSLKKKNTVFSPIEFNRTYKVMYGLLFIFSFTYYGNHGLGDDSYIPLGHGETMEAGDLNAYFSPNGKIAQLQVKAYQVKGNNLCMSVDSGIVVYDLNTKQIINFNEISKYNKYAFTHHLPRYIEFLDFFKQYDVYWSGWRFWILP